jgi:hypothetical protein
MIALFLRLHKITNANDEKVVVLVVWVIGSVRP